TREPVALRDQRRRGAGGDRGLLRGNSRETAHRARRGVMRSLVRGIASACIRQGACARHPEPTYQAASHSAPRARLARITGLAWMFLLCFVRCETAETWETGVDFTRTNGAFRALHGVNKGPLGPGGLINLTAEHRELGIPYTRLHDCYWPNPYVVDIHAVFPDFHADPSKAESYDFRLTDEYLSAVVASGARIVYRLG